MSTKYSKRQKLFFLLVIAISILLIIRLSKGIFELLKTKERVDSAKSQVDRLKSEQQQLKDQLKHYQSDLYVESQIRDQLGLAKPGEVVVILPKDLPIASSSSQTAQQPLIPIWKKWAQLFGL